METQAEMSDELSLEDQIAVAWSEFHCASGATNKRVKWREYARLMRKREENREHEPARITR